MLALLLITTPFILVLLATLSRLSRLIKNYRAARRYNLPIIITPFSWQDPIWALVCQNFSFIRKLPFGLGNWFDYSYLSWQLQDRNETHARLGPAVVIVSAANTEISLSDAEASEKVLQDWKQWIKSEDLNAFMEVFGKNVVTANGHDWQRHRKIVGSAFKEATNTIVWDEGIKQAASRCEIWAGRHEMSLETLLGDNGSLAMNVLIAAGFSSQKTEMHTADAGLQSLRIILENIFKTILISMAKAPRWLLPKGMKHLQIASEEFRRYMVQMVSREREDFTVGGQAKGSLGSALVQANEAARNEHGNKLFLADDELYGNLFLINLAGFETTASALTYALPLLAAHTDVQEWASEEARAILASSKGYSDTFPLLVRTLAVLYETLRLWGSVVQLPRYSGSETRRIEVRGQSYEIPPHTYVTPSFVAVHSDPKLFGANPLEWRPQRWIGTTATGQEYLVDPPEGAGFFPWSHGPRSCPGKKFSQVEFVAMIATMLKDYEFKPAIRGDESLEASRQRLLDIVQDSYFNVSPKFRRPRMAGLTIVSRQGSRQDQHTESMHT